jgi:uncharacterized protein YqgC (DUF456 family)
MSQSARRAPIVETLLNSLEAERYVRGPLLATVVDELVAARGLETAAEYARALLLGLESGQLEGAEFAARVASLRQLVRRLDAARGGSSMAQVPWGRYARAASAFA